MGKLLENKEERKRLIKEVVEVFNNDPMIEENEKVTDQEIEELLNDEERIKSFEKARKAFSFREKKENIFNTLKKQYEGKEGNRQLSRLIEFSMDISGTEEADRRNKELMEIYYDKEKGQKFINETMREIMTCDPKDFFYLNDDECFDKLSKDNGHLESLFLIDDLIVTDKQNVLNPILNDALAEKKTIFQQAANMRAKLITTCSPFYLLVPEKMLKNEKVNLLGSKLSKIFDKPENKELIDEYIYKNLKDQDITGYNSNKFNEDLEKNSYEYIKENVLNNTLDKNFFTNKCFQVKGERLPTKDVFYRLNENRIKKEDISIVELSDHEKENIRESLDKDFIVNANQLVEKFNTKVAGLKKAKEDIYKTLGLFTRDSKQFKTMKFMITEIVRKCDEFNNDPKNKDPKKIAVFAGKLEKNLKKMKIATNAYKNKKAEDRLVFQRKGKKFNERTENRLIATDYLLGVLSNDLFANSVNKELEVEDVSKSVAINMRDDSLAKQIVNTLEKENTVKDVSEQIEISTDINKNDPNINVKSK